MAQEITIRSTSFTVKEMREALDKFPADAVVRLPKLYTGDVDQNVTEVRTMLDWEGDVDCVQIR